MIYVILCPAFKSSEDEFEKLIKIGYTNDDKKDRRYYQYTSHNPTARVLYEIPECGVDIENLLHSYFSKHRYSNFGKEWFYWNEEIIDFFKNHKTRDSILDSIEPTIIVRCSKRRFSGFRKYIYSIIDNCLNYMMSINEDYEISQVMKDREDCFNEIDSSKLTSKEDILKSILSHFVIDSSNYEEYINRDIPDNIKVFVEDFNTLPGFYEKMKAVCESDFSENERLMILEQVPILYKNLYLQMGPERLKANSYNITFIKKELYNNNIVENNNQDICSLFLQYFKIGEKYLLSDIKNTIKQIYITVGLECKPKAIEIEKYFEVRKIQVTNKETGKKDHGYEILKKK